MKNTGRSRTDIEIDVLASLIYQYRANVKTFSWDAVREVIIDRLEGSRRSIKGHEKEAVVRTVILSAIQQYFGHHQHYGMYASIELPATQVMIANESYDVSINLLSTQGQRLSRVLVPIKTRETEGGGHSHLFSRDILSAIGTVRNENPADYVMVVIAAKNWSPREADNLREIVDHLAIFNLDPGEFVAFNDAEQERLNEFVASVLNGAVLPKSHQTPSESDE